jgi:hypothetical protein
VIDPRSFQIGRLVRQPFNLVDAFLTPGKLTIEGEGRLYFLSPVLLLLPLWVFRWRDRHVGALIGPALVYLVLLITIQSETNLRYLIPGIVPLTIASTALAMQVSEGKPAFVQYLTRGLISGACVVPALIAICIVMLVARPLGYIVGTTSANEYMRAHGNFNVRTHQRLVEFARRLPPGSRTLMLYEGRGFYIPTSVIEDVHLTNWPLLAARLPQQGCPKGSGITHLIAGEAYAKRYEERGAPPEVIKWDLFAQFAARCLTLMYADSAHSLYRFRASMQQTTAR